MTDLWAETVPNWIVAGTGVATLGAAIAAAVFAKRAAKAGAAAASSTRDQADTAKAGHTHATETAKRQEEATGDQLALARQQAARAEADARFSRRQAVESRLDARAPVVVPRGYLSPSGHIRISTQEDPDYAVIDEATFVDNPSSDAKFQVAVDLYVANVSDQPALVEIGSYDGGSFLRKQRGEFYVINPGENEVLMWEREYSATEFGSEESIGDASRSRMRVVLWVSDLAGEIRDTYTYDADLSFFRRAQDRLLVTPQPTVPWRETIAKLNPERLYARLDSERNAD